jgi:hypothetical protein
MRTIKEIISDTEKTSLSPIQVGNLMLELMPHHQTLMQELDEVMNTYSTTIATQISAGKSMAVAKALTEGSEVGRLVREAKTNLAYIEEYISSLKYLARGIEKEYTHANY